MLMSITYFSIISIEPCILHQSLSYPIKEYYSGKNGYSEGLKLIEMDYTSIHTCSIIFSLSNIVYFR